MRFSHRFVFLATVALVACSEAGTSPTELRPQFGTQVTRSPLLLTVTNSCNGDVVTLEGTQHVSTKTETKGNHTRAKIHINWSSLQGVSDTGNRYVLPTAAHQFTEVSLEPPFPSSQDTNVMQQLVSRNSEENLFIHIIQTVTFDGTNTTTEIKKMETECRG